MTRPSRALVGVAALAVAGSLALPVLPAVAVSPDVVISEVYGGGGNSGATLRNDFVELHNLGSAAVDLEGWSVQYASAGGSTWQVTGLTGRIEPGERYLVQQAEGAGGAEELPTPDAVGNISMSATSGRVALVTTTAALPCGPDCDRHETVRDFVGFGSANDAETTPAPSPSNTESASRRGSDTDVNSADFTVGAPTPESTGRGVEEPPEEPVEGVAGLAIHDVQGAAHLSPYAGDTVLDVPGVVTATKGDGFWMQATTPDDDIATSEGLYVYKPRTMPAVGDRVLVTGDVVEYRPGGASGDNLTITELTGTPTVEVVGTTDLPAATLVGPGGRVPPSDVIDDDATGSVETSGSFDAATDGIDFWESMEGMLLAVEDARATGPTSRFGELPVVTAGAEPATPRGGVHVAPEDFNPERIILDDVLAAVPTAHVGDRLPGTTVGVLDYSFANFKLLPLVAPTVQAGGLSRETTPAARGGELSIASYNVENLDALDPQEKFDALARQIVDNLGSPDVIGLEEVQDDSGPEDDGTTTAEETLRLLTEAIARAGGPAYDWRQIDPVDLAEGGEPGGNIRVAFLFNTDRDVEFVDRGTPTSSTPATVVTGPDGEAHLVTSPARVAPDSPAWAGSRVPLVGEFRRQGKTFFAIANHFSSKGGDDPLFGRWQPPVRTSEVDRHQQAREVRDFVDELLAADPDAKVAVVGDINDFEFSETVDILVGAGETALTDLPRTLPAGERYTYVYEGNSQVLDHILLSPGFVAAGYDYDIVHVNAEFADQISDHDPQVVRIAATRGEHGKGGHGKARGHHKKHGKGHHKGRGRGHDRHHR